jgi:hypothetical protein
VPRGIKGASRPVPLGGCGNVLCAISIMVVHVIKLHSYFALCRLETAEQVWLMRKCLDIWNISIQNSCRTLSIKWRMLLGTCWDAGICRHPSLGIPLLSCILPWVRSSPGKDTAGWRLRSLCMWLRHVR